MEVDDIFGGEQSKRLINMPDTIPGMDPEVVFDKLRNFDTPDELAEFFKDQGVVAWPGRAESCAISKWVQDVTGLDETRVLTTGSHVRIGDKHLEHTAAMKAFINRFDRGEYEDLIPQQIHIPDPMADRCLKCHVSGRELATQRREILGRYGNVPLNHPAFATCPGSGGRPQEKITQRQAEVIYDKWLAQPEKWGEIGAW